MAMAAVDFAAPASEAQLEALAEKLRARNFEAVIVQDGAEAKAEVLKRIPAGAQVHSGKSKTLQDTGIWDVINNPDEYNAVRPRYLSMDRQTRAREIRKLISSPDFMLGSVQAITEDGVLVTASATSSQLGPYAVGAGKLILVVGSQKIVPDLDTALRRIREYVLPWEDAQVRKMLPIGSFVGKILIIEREWVPGRLTVVLVREPVGI